MKPDEIIRRAQRALSRTLGEKVTLKPQGAIVDYPGANSTILRSAVVEGARRYEPALGRRGAGRLPGTARV